MSNSTIMSSIQPTIEIASKGTSLIWLPYLSLACFLLGLSFASFLKYHFKNRGKYKERADKIRETKETAHHEFDRLNSISVSYSQQNGEIMTANITGYSYGASPHKYNERSNSDVSISENHLLRQSFSNPAFSSKDEKRQSPEGSTKEKVSLPHISEENLHANSNSDKNEQSSDGNSNSSPICMQTDFTREKDLSNSNPSNNSKYKLSSIKNFSLNKSLTQTPIDSMEETYSQHSFSRESSEISLQSLNSGQTAFKKFQFSNVLTLPEPHFNSSDNDSFAHELSQDESTRPAVDVFALERIRHIQSMNEDDCLTVYFVNRVDMTEWM